MTATHARVRIRRHRLAGLLRRRQPDLIPMRAADYGGSYDYPGWDDERAEKAAEQDSARPHRPPHPPWVTAPQPAYQPPRPAPSAGPGTLDALYAAADLRDQDAQLSGGHDLTVIDAPVTRIRPYAPEPELEPEPAWYPPPDLHADLAECLIFRDTVRDQFVRQERTRGNRPGGPWGQVYADVFERRTTLVPAPDWRVP